MRIKIVTMNSSYNYGAMLQAYALQDALKKMGYECEFIDQRKFNRKKVAYSKTLKSLHKIPFEIIFRKQLEEGYRKFEKFIEDEQHLTKDNYSDYDKLLNNPPEADVYITGSDQVWNPYSFKPINFLDFVPDNTKKISYAASMGVNHIPGGKKERFKWYINRIDCISVREQSAKQLIGELTDKDIKVNVDPVFLLSKERWKQLEKPVYEIDYPYILCYILYRPGWLNKRLKELHKKTGLNIVLVHNDSFRNVYHNKVIRYAGPKEFLWLMRNANMVITSSFHGTAFAALNNKKFYSILNPARPSRISDMLKLLQLTARMAEKEIEFNTTEIDYTKVNRIIEHEKDKSFKYLKSALQ